MRTSDIFALATGILALPVEARSVVSVTESPKVVGLSTERKSISDPIQRDRLRRRGDTVTASLDNEETLYFINGTVGTPAQSFRMHLDTGSSDMWLNTASSAYCSQQSAPCAFAGTYNANDSSTQEYVGSWFNISYVDGSGASGDYVTDTVTVGGTTMDSLQFGIGYTSSSGQGILGIGYPVNEVQVGRAGMDAYQNLPAKLVASGDISRNAYSLWLNDLDANTGSILFGGVDSAQYTGDLQTLPIQANGGVYSEFLITLTGVALGDTNIASDQALAVLLDSGSSLSYLPNAMANSIYESVGAEYIESDGAAYVPCALADNGTNTLDFTFTSPLTISVGMDELVLDLVTTAGQRPEFADGTPACLFGIMPAGASTNVLGDTFLRSAYVVYDMANNEISLAQTNFNATGTSVSEIPAAGAGGVPGATAVSNAVSATAGVSTTNGAATLNSNDGTSGAATTAASAPLLLALALSVGAAAFHTMFS
ncbi:eukaryotic aspartyl protease [Xylariaceae sp. FL0804]|nr:eukaryotic aspartyl protease [Xylariaceae sp. FL0804]